MIKKINLKIFLVVLSISFFSIIEPAETSDNKKLLKEKLWQKMSQKVDKITDALGMPIDENIKRTVIILNLLGFETSASCEGHIDRCGVCPWVSFWAMDNEIYDLKSKLNEALSSIDKIEVELKQKNKNITNLELNNAPELDEPIKEVNAIRTRIERLQKNKVKRLYELLKAFYKKNTLDYDRMLILQTREAFAISSNGSEFQSVRTESDKLEKLKEYQEEMQLFTDFLINYYFES